MSIGKMRQLLQIQRFTSTPDGGGGSTVVFSKVADVFAQIYLKMRKKVYLATRCEKLQAI